jgi:hypothetical protein
MPRKPAPVVGRKAKSPSRKKRPDLAPRFVEKAVAEASKRSSLWEREPEVRVEAQAG